MTCCSYRDKLSPIYWNVSQSVSYPIIASPYSPRRLYK